MATTPNDEGKNTWWINAPGNFLTLAFAQKIYHIKTLELRALNFSNIHHSDDILIDW